MLIGKYSFLLSDEHTMNQVKAKASTSCLFSQTTCIQCGIINWEVAPVASILLNAAAQACLEILMNFYLTNAIQSLPSNLRSNLIITH